jgi:hypothetical protein
MGAMVQLLFWEFLSIRLHAHRCFDSVEPDRENGVTDVALRPPAPLPIMTPLRRGFVYFGYVRFGSEAAVQQCPFWVSPAILVFSFRWILGQGGLGHLY